MSTFTVRFPDPIHLTADGKADGPALTDEKGTPIVVTFSQTCEALSQDAEFAKGRIADNAAQAIVRGAVGGVPFNLTDAEVEKVRAVIDAPTNGMLIVALGEGRAINVCAAPLLYRQMRPHFDVFY